MDLQEHAEPHQTVNQVQTLQCTRADPSVIFNANGIEVPDCDRFVIKPAVAAVLQGYPIAERDLPNVVQTNRFVGLAFCRGKRRQEQARKNCNDRNNDKQLNKGERSS